MTLFYPYEVVLPSHLDAFTSDISCCRSPQRLACFVEAISSRGIAQQRYGLWGLHEAFKMGYHGNIMGKPYLFMVRNIMERR